MMTPLETWIPTRGMCCFVHGGCAALCMGDMLLCAWHAMGYWSSKDMGRHVTAMKMKIFEECRTVQRKCTPFQALPLVAQLSLRNVDVKILPVYACMAFGLSKSCRCWGEGCICMHGVLTNRPANAAGDKRVLEGATHGVETSCNFLSLACTVSAPQQSARWTSHSHLLPDTLLGQDRHSWTAMYGTLR